MDKKILVIGLGSMGNRRIRCLQFLGIHNIVGFDTREDRRKNSFELYKISVSDDFNDLIKKQAFDAWIISVPPDCHHIYMKQAILHNVPAFIEASVVDTDMIDIMTSASLKNILLAPSCTLYFHPAVKAIFDIVRKNELGKISSVLYHSGQYLPDWHTYEPVEDYYVSKNATGGAREIVPFELTWLTQMLGFPQRITGFYKKTIEILGAEDIDDTYCLLLDYQSFLMSLTVDVVSRVATRRLTINGSEKQLVWNWDVDAIQIFDSSTGMWSNLNYEIKAAQNGYNKNITEGMYIEEMETFLNFSFKGGLWPSSLEHDHKVLRILYLAETSSDSDTIMPFK